MIVPADAKWWRGTDHAKAVQGGNNRAAASRRKGARIRCLKHGIPADEVLPQAPRGGPVERNPAQSVGKIPGVHLV